MKQKLLAALLIVLVIAGAVIPSVGAMGATTYARHFGFRSSLEQTSTDPNSDWECTLPLRVTVRQGPDSGLELFGLVHMNIDDMGGTEGMYEIVAPEDQIANVPMVGQIMGRSVSLMFNVSEDTQIYGVGTSQDPIATHCHTTWGGPVVGPEEGDLGDWVCTPDLCCGGGVCKVCTFQGSTNVCITHPTLTQQPR